MATVDQSGEVLPDDAGESAIDADNVIDMQARRDELKKKRPHRTVTGMGGLGGPGSIGASIWEILHPEQVQAEAAAVGAPIPSIMDVITGNAGDIANDVTTNVSSALDATTSGIKDLSKWLAIGAVLWLVLEVTRNPTLKRYRGE